MHEEHSDRPHDTTWCAQAAFRRSVFCESPRRCCARPKRGSLPRRGVLHAGTYRVYRKVGDRTGARGFWLIFRMGYDPMPPPSYRLSTSMLFI